jgi:hypothetical protein
VAASNRICLRSHASYMAFLSRSESTAYIYKYITPSENCSASSQIVEFCTNTRTALAARRRRYERALTRVGLLDLQVPGQGSLLRHGVIVYPLVRVPFLQPTPTDRREEA